MRRVLFVLATVTGLLSVRGCFFHADSQSTAAAITATPAVLSKPVAKTEACPCLSGGKCVCPNCGCAIAHAPAAAEKPTIIPVKAVIPAKNVPYRAPTKPLTKAPAGMTCGPGGCAPANGGSWRRGRIFGRRR